MGPFDLLPEGEPRWDFSRSVFGGRDQYNDILFQIYLLFTAYGMKTKLNSAAFVDGVRICGPRRGARNPCRELSRKRFDHEFSVRARVATGAARSRASGFKRPFVLLRLSSLTALLVVHSRSRRSRRVRVLIPPRYPSFARYTRPPANPSGEQASERSRSEPRPWKPKHFRVLNDQRNGGGSGGNRTR